MGLTSVLTIELTGPVDNDILGVLQRELGLEGGGRLTDDWDEEFGSRLLNEEPDAWLTLYRGWQTPDLWTVDVATELPMPGDLDVQRLRNEILSAAQEVALHARQTYPLEVSPET